jgi:hypothetical protein
MLEAVQANRRGGSLEGLVDIGADAAQLQARRMLDQMIKAEGAEVEDVPAGQGMRSMAEARWDAQR